MMLFMDDRVGKHSTKTLTTMPNERPPIFLQAELRNISFLVSFFFLPPKNEEDWLETYSHYSMAATLSPF
jgi:hypothetical protein